MMTEADYFAQIADEPLDEATFTIFCPLCERRIPVRQDGDSQRMDYHWRDRELCRFSGREVKDRVRARQGV